MVQSKLINRFPTLFDTRFIQLNQLLSHINDKKPEKLNINPVRFFTKGWKGRFYSIYETFIYFGVNIPLSFKNSKLLSYKAINGKIDGDSFNVINNVIVKEEKYENELSHYVNVNQVRREVNYWQNLTDMATRLHSNISYNDLMKMDYEQALLIIVNRINETKKSANDSME